MKMNVAFVVYEFAHSFPSGQFMAQDLPLMFDVNNNVIDMWE